MAISMMLFQAGFLIAIIGAIVSVGFMLLDVFDLVPFTLSAPWGMLVMFIGGILAVLGYFLQVVGWA